MERALVTGASGFVGQWLCRELLARDWDVAGTTLDPSLPLTTLTADERTSIRWVTSDLRSGDDVAHALDVSRPDAIFHLAGISFLPTAASDPMLALEVNVVATARLLDGLRPHRGAGTLDPIVIVVGSAEQYGRHDVAEMPLAESAAQHPISMYGASKAAQEVIALQAHRASGARIVVTRSFNHSGAGQSEHFLLPALVKRVLAARAARARLLPIGNLTPVRDYLHVRDVARAYADLAEHGVAGEAYNVSGGVGTSVLSIAERVLAIAGVQAELEQESALVRAADVPVLIGDSGKLRAATGWSPRESIDIIIEDLIRAATH